MSVLPNDPLFQYQWFLNNVGQSGGGIGSDINVLPVWPDYTGRGIRVAIVDDGVQLDHPDLVQNIDLAASWDALTNSPGGGPVTSGDKHGTPVAGLVAEVADNGIGGSGVAPDATLMSYRIGFLEEWVASAPVVAFQKALENNADVVNNSWGDGTAFATDIKNPGDLAFFSALTALATTGREGKGSIVLFSNGNNGDKRYDGNLDNAVNNRYVIAVGALDDTGVRSAYSTPGANLLISAPGGASTGQQPDQPGDGTLTTDRTSVEGYNTLFGEPGDYQYNFNGTSAAAPIVSGVVALMLEANPGLGYRDVQEILAHSAQFVDPAAESWKTTKSGTWNGGGALFSRDYGFGEVDAHGAVRLAEVYAYLHPVARSDANVTTVQASSGPVDIKAAVDQPAVLKLSLADGVDLNHLDLNLGASFANPSEMFINLKSPSGTTIYMVEGPQNAHQIKTEGKATITTIAWPEHGFTIGTNAFWGEKSGGEWQVEIQIVTKGIGGTLKDVTLTGYGNSHSTQREFVYTDGFASVIDADSWRQDPPSRTGLKVGAGETAVVNAAAVSSDVTVDLAGHRAEITGETIVIDAATKVTMVFTGDGNDSLVGDGSDNMLLAGRGVNTIDGGGGVDTALYIGSRANYVVTYDATGTFTASGWSNASSDTAVRIEKATFAEGTLYVQAATDTALDVARLYDGLLFRDPDADGYRYWTNQALQGSTASAIGLSFLQSTEYANEAGKLDNATFVSEVYLELLGREADSAGAAYWTASLDSGALNRVGVVLSIGDSEEYATTRLTGLFTAVADLGNLWG